MSDLKEAQETANQASLNMRAWIQQLEPLLNRSKNDDANKLLLAVHAALIRCCQDIDRAMFESRHQADVEEMTTRIMGPGTMMPTVDEEPKKEPPKPSKEVDRVIEYYQAFHPTARPGDKDKKLIRQRLKDGFDVEKLGRAIKGCHHSPFHSGKNESGTKYQSLELIMRDPGRVLQFIEIEEAHGGNRDTPKAQAIIAWGRYQKFGHKGMRTEQVLANLPSCEPSNPKFGTEFRQKFIDEYERQLG